MDEPSDGAGVQYNGAGRVFGRASWAAGAEDTTGARVTRPFESSSVPKMERWSELILAVLAGRLNSPSAVCGAGDFPASERF